MNSEIQNVVLENLDNEVSNGYDHDWLKTPDQYLDEMVDYSGTPELNTENDRQSARDAVEYWRVCKG